MAKAPVPGSYERDAAGNVKPKDPSVTVIVDGTKHTARIGEVTARMASEIRRETGMSSRALFAAAGDDPDLDIVAALVWIARRQNGEPSIAFGDVLDEIGYDSEIEAADIPAEEDEDSPEA